MTAPTPTNTRFKVKNPGSTVDYQFSWTEYLAAQSDSISTATCVVDNPTGSEDDLTINSVSHDSTTVTVWVSAGVVGTIYQLTNTVTTAGTRTDTWTALIEIQEK
jgi:hypothetical protein